jgi:hypothetical protein
MRLRDSWGGSVDYSSFVGLPTFRNWQRERACPGTNSNNVKLIGSKLSIVVVEPCESLQKAEGRSSIPR